MDISSWDLFYKIHESNGNRVTSQMCYEPRVSPQNDVFCMNYCFPCEYQATQERYSYTKDLVEYTFQREVKYLDIFKDRPWAPEILDIKDRKIFIKWYGKTCNDSVYKDNDLPPTWLDDITQIILDQANAGYLKCSMYPHSHFYDNTGQMRAIDFYATVDRSDPFIDYDKISGIVGIDTDRFEKARIDNSINVEHIFQSGLLHYSKWPVNLTTIYDKIYS